MRRLLPMILMLCAVCGVVRGQEAVSGIEPGLTTPFHSHLNKLLALTVRDGRLLLNRDLWPGGAGRTVDDYRNAAALDMQRMGAASTAPVGGVERKLVQGQLLAALDMNAAMRASANGWSGGENIAAELRDVRWQTNLFHVQCRARYDTGEFYFQMREMQEPTSQSIEVREILSPASLKITALINHSTRRVEVEQRDNEIAVTLIDTQDVETKVTKKSGTFLQLVESEDAWLRAEVMPVLLATGFQLPLTERDAAVVDAAIALSLPPDPGMQARVRKLVQQLDAFEFDIREEATRELKTLYLDYGDIIDEMAKLDWPAEPYIRLQQVMQSAPRRMEAAEFVRQMKLAGNLAYFIRVLPGLDDARVARLTPILERLSPQRCASPGEWRDWAASQR